MAILLYGGTALIASQAATAIHPAAGAEPRQSFPHIALLLPANAPAFAASAEAVKNGFLAAAMAHSQALPPIRLYPATDDGQAAVATYHEAVASGAQLVVGPLTRSGVTALASTQPLPIPTLALNVPESASQLPPNLYALSLQLEGEARQVAQLAAREGRMNALTVHNDTPLSRRIQQAFVEEFSRAGGRHAAALGYTPDPLRLAGIRQAVAASGSDMAFLALDFPLARLLRPHLGPVPLYATSQVHPGAIGPLTGSELAGVRFMDMPWMLQPDHPAVMIYRRGAAQENPDLERLYALGIDAFRVALDLLAGRREPIDGVTGHLTLGGDRHYLRELTRAQFVEGRLVVYPDSP